MEVTQATQAVQKSPSQRKKYFLAKKKTKAQKVEKWASSRHFPSAHRRHTSPMSVLVTAAARRAARGVLLLRSGASRSRARGASVPALGGGPLTGTNGMAHVTNR
jgi:hypothetical protein